MQRVPWNEWTEQQYISSARLSELSKCPLAAEWPSGLLLVSWIAAQQYLLEHAVQTHFPLAALALLMLWKSFKSSLLCKAGRTSTSFPLMRACVCALCQILPVYCSVCFLFLFFYGCDSVWLNIMKQRGDGCLWSFLHWLMLAHY